MPSQSHILGDFLNHIHYKVRERQDHQLGRLCGVMTKGFKESLSITVGTNEILKFWLRILDDLKNCSVQDVQFFCIYGLVEFKDAV